ncbi:MAG: hypothetical protein JXK08_09000 [Flavobacteriaceae bacterium]|nr:hypothetical protein [Flavobacteriaceae bacterium]
MKNKVLIILLLLSLQFIFALLHKLINDDANVLNDVISGTITIIIVAFVMIKGQSNFNKNKIED